MIVVNAHTIANTAVNNLSTNASTNLLLTNIFAHLIKLETVATPSTHIYNTLSTINSNASTTYKRLKSSHLNISQSTPSSSLATSTFVNSQPPTPRPQDSTLHTINPPTTSGTSQSLQHKKVDSFYRTASTTSLIHTFTLPTSKISLKSSLYSSTAQRKTQYSNMAQKPRPHH